jgi:hypothetical protein
MGEIMRREANIFLDRFQTWTSRHSIGFHSMQKSPDKANNRRDESLVYFVFPFVRTFSRLHRLFKVLLAQRQPVDIAAILNGAKSKIFFFNFLKIYSDLAPGILNGY